MTTPPKRPRRDLPLWVIEYSAMNGDTTFVVVMPAVSAQAARRTSVRLHPHVRVVSVN